MSDLAGMYTEHFGLRENPFRATPDPRFFFESPVYDEGYATLVYGILERKGFIVLTGEVGTGKTLLLRRLMEQLGSSARFVFFYNTTLTFDELVDFMCAELEVPVDGLRRLAKLARLNTFLIEEATRGGTVALLVDEAQHLRPEVLENLRLMSNLETATAKLLQVVLVGQPELDDVLSDPRLRQLAQRVAARYSLTPLPPDEVGPFMRHRLVLAGRPRQDLFAPEAVRRIALYTRGIPRLINIVCDAALLAAYGAGLRQVHAGIVDEVALDLRLRRPDARGAPISPRAASGRRPALPQVARRRPRRLAVGAAAVIVAGSAVGLGLHASLGARVADPGGVDEAPVGAATPGTRSVRPGATLAIASPDPDSPGAASARPDSARPIAPSAVSTDAGTRPDSNGRGHPLMVPRGATISQIVLERYRRYDLLALDLITELNPEIDNLDRIVAGQSLWLPQLTLEGRLRRHPDGSYRLIVATLAAAGAERLAETIGDRGYAPVVTPRRISPTSTLHRVEIANLQSREAAADAWDDARRRGWASDGPR
jgi:type II secretory pathway predicted ATPase ExeA